MSSSRFTNHPFPIKLLNKSAPLLHRCGLLPTLSVSRLVSRAKRKTGLQDFGDDWFLEPLEVLIQSINEEADLSALGQFIIQKRLVDALSTRLKVQHLLEQHPEIGDVDLGQVIVIAGLQRTGTTLLQRLMGTHPKIRALASWEVLDPLPGNEAKKVKAAQTAEKGLKYIAPDFFAIHPVEHDMPEEDILLLDTAFMSQSSEATMRVPIYAKWLESQDHTKAYKDLQVLLKILMWNRPEKAIVLKSPHHLEYLDIILKVFPGAKIIQTHRDPQKTLPSFVSMVCHGAGIFSENVDSDQFAEHWRIKVLRLLDRSSRVRQAATEGTFHDVAYNDLVGDPQGELEKLYAWAGIEFDETAKTRASDMLNRQRKDKYGVHHYRAEDFGLTVQGIESDFASYCEQFSIAKEES